MSDKLNDDGLREADESNNPSVNEPSESSRPPFERRQFGGTERQSKPFDEDVPISRSDLKKGAQELSENSVLILIVKCLSRKFGSVLCHTPC